MINEQKLLSVSDLARILGRTEASIRAALYRNPDSLPKMMTREHGGRRVWSVDVVNEWIAQHQEKPSEGA